MQSQLDLNAQPPVQSNGNMAGMDQREQARHADELLAERLDVLVPTLMDRAELDAWVIAAREYNEDPVLATMLPATWQGTARRRTILIFLRDGDDVARSAVARYAVGDIFNSTWDADAQPDQWLRVAEILDEADPQRIGVNRSKVFALADGLSSTEFELARAALGPRLSSRLVSAEKAAIGWLETRLPKEVPVMQEACETGHRFLRQALSGEVIIPGETTTTDVEWWLRQSTHDSGYQSWFHPTVSVQRQAGEARQSFSTRPSDTVIEFGDLVHIDFGIVDRGYCTDQQQHAYVLKPGEREAPKDLRDGLAQANRLQDLLMGEFISGRTGNEILVATRRAAEAAGIDGLIYTHPIGIHGHAAGPTIGLWDQQDEIPGQGDYPLHPNTAYSIELQAQLQIGAWNGQTVQFMLEEDAWFDGERCRFLDGRQTDLWLI